jgi:hypothetical protein
MLSMEGGDGVGGRNSRRAAAWVQSCRVRGYTYSSALVDARKRPREENAKSDLLRLDTLLFLRPLPLPSLLSRRPLSVSSSSWLSCFPFHVVGRKEGDVLFSSVFVIATLLSLPFLLPSLFSFTTSSFQADIRRYSLFDNLRRLSLRKIPPFSPLILSPVAPSQTFESGCRYRSLTLVQGGAARARARGPAKWTGSSHRSTTITINLNSPSLLLPIRSTNSSTSNRPPHLPGSNPNPPVKSAPRWRRV